MRSTLVLLSLAFVTPLPAAAQPSTSPNRTPASQERICETIVVTGSRLGARKFCGTRAEWNDRRQQDKDVVNQIQTRINGPCATVNQHSGAPAC